jgi:hypothetical protein
VSRIAHARHHFLLVTDLTLDVRGIPGGVSDVERVDPLALTRRLESSERLRQRRFELLPLTGPTAAFTEVQGRAPGGSTSLEGLGELISSIASVGVLQPDVEVLAAVDVDVLGHCRPQVGDVLVGDVETSPTEPVNGLAEQPGMKAATQLTTRLRHRAWAAWSASWRWRTSP